MYMNTCVYIYTIQPTSKTHFFFEVYPTLRGWKQHGVPGRHMVVWNRRCVNRRIEMNIDKHLLVWNIDDTWINDDECIDKVYR